MTSWAAFQAQERPSARPFAALLGVLTLWAVLALGSEFPVGSGDGLVAAVFSFGQIGVALFVPRVWVVYVLGYTGRGTGITRRQIAMFAGMGLPVVCSGIVFAAGLPIGTIEAVLASLLGTEILYLFGLFLYGTYLVVGHGRQHERISTLQTAVVVAGVAVPYLAGLVGNSSAVADGVTLGLLASDCLFAVAVHRYPVLTGFPKADYVARTRVGEAVQEAVVVSTGTVVSWTLTRPREHSSITNQMR